MRRISSWARALAALALAATARPASAGGFPDATPRAAVLVGNNDGGAGLLPLAYAERDALAMADVLRRYGGVPQPAVLLGRTAPEVVAALKRVAEAAGPGALVLLYYSGHADEDGLRLGATRLEHAALRALIAELPASTVVAVVDACNAGALTGVKGGSAEAVRLDPAFLADQQVRGRAIVTATSGRQKAREYDDLGGSLFTQSLLIGLLGAADVSGDKRVSLSEAYHYAAERTSNESALRGTTQRPTYQWTLEGTGELILTSLPERGGNLVFGAAASGPFEIRDVERQRVVLRVPADAPRPLALQLGPGVYSLHQPVGRRLQRVYRAVVEVGRDSTGWLETGRYEQVAPGRAKGALPWTVSAAYGVERGFVTDAGLDHSLGVRAGAAVDEAGALSVGFGLEGAMGRSTRTIDDARYETAVTQARGLAFAAYAPLLWRRLALALNADVGGGLAYQAFVGARGDRRNTAPFARTALASGPALLFDTWQIGAAATGAATLYRGQDTSLGFGWGGMLQCGFLLGE